LTEKDLTKYKRTVERVLNKWVKLLGLDRCTLTIEFSDESKTSEEGMSVIAETSASWQYNAAYIIFYLANFNKVKPDRIEMAIIHELIHILVNEMRNYSASDGTEHEERVVCSLTDAVLNAYNHAH
jgi:predicted metallopeptidase